MMGIILLILKFAGILLCICLAVLLALLLLVLFVPVRYDLRGKKEDNLQVEGKVHWLLHIVTLEIRYEDEEMKKILRIFGVPVWKE